MSAHLRIASADQTGLRLDPPAAPVASLFGVFLLALMLSACGFSGPLFLPEKQEAAPPEQTEPQDAGEQESVPPEQTEPQDAGEQTGDVPS